MPRTLLRRLRSQQTPVAFLGAAAILLFVLLLAYESWWDYRQARDEVRAEVTARAQLMGEHLERSLQSVEVVLQALAADVNTTPWEELAASHELTRRLKRIALSLPQVRSIWMVDQNGYMRVYSERFPSPPLDALDRDYFAAHAGPRLTREMAIAPPQVGKFTGRDFVPVSLPMLVRGYAFRGVIAAAVEPAYYFPLLTTQGGCGDCSAAMLHANGDVLFASSESGGLEPGVVDGVSQMVVSTTYPVAVVVWVPDAAILELWWKRESGLLLAGLAALVLLAWLVHRAATTGREMAEERDRLCKLTRTLEERNQELELARTQAEEARGQEREQRKAAAAANEAKSRFLARMSHELRTPLNAIIGFSDLIRSRKGAMAPAKLDEYVGDIHASGHHLLSLINDILDLSKIEAGRFALNEDRVSLAALADSVTRVIQAHFADKNLAVRCEVPPLSLLADERALRQALLNLLSNAGKYAPSHSEIALTARLAPDALYLTVRDEGPGMDAAQIAAALEPFGQEPQAYSSSGREGTGLGLNITRALAEMHDGRLVIESAPGQGTRASLVLPAERILGDAPPVAAVG
jgi:signal transduction histidine kinase